MTVKPRALPDLAQTCALRTCKCGERFATHDVARRKCDGCYLNSAMYGTDGTADVDDEACGVEGGQGREVSDVDWSARAFLWVMSALFAVSIIALAYALLDAGLKGGAR